MSACPRSSCTTRRSAPPLNKCVANEWRNLCGCTPCSPDKSAYLRTICQTATRSIGLPLKDRNSRKWSRPSRKRANDGRVSFRYSSIATIAGSPTGTMRCLFPFPITTTQPSVALKSFIFREPTSLARKPEAYITSSMARSRRHKSPVSAFGASTNFRI